MKFGEHERSIRVAQGAAKSNSSFLSDLIYAQRKAQTNSFITYFLVEVYDKNPKKSELDLGHSLLNKIMMPTRATNLIVRANLLAML